ncbi:MAG: hypothetical protein WCA00_00015 [Candidatus Acidiferrales bacterium]
MRVTTAAQAAAELQFENLDRAFEVHCVDGSLVAKSYLLPLLSKAQTILARRLSRALLARGESWLQITCWNSDSDSNLEMFYGYRKGRGEARELVEASVHRFSPDEIEEMASILGMVFYFLWDARIFGRDQTYQVLTSNDEIIDYATCSHPLSLELEREFSHLGMNAAK